MWEERVSVSGDILAAPPISQTREMWHRLRGADSDVGHPLAMKLMELTVQKALPYQLKPIG
jgi:hypothetical protein